MRTDLAIFSSHGRCSISPHIRSDDIKIHRHACKNDANSFLPKKRNHFLGLSVIDNEFHADACRTGKFEKTAFMHIVVATKPTDRPESRAATNAEGTCLLEQPLPQQHAMVLPCLVDINPKTFTFHDALLTQ